MPCSCLSLGFLLPPSAVLPMGQPGRHLYDGPMVVASWLRSTSPALAVCGVAWLSSGFARADAIDDLQPGQWYEIPDTPMRDECPPDTAYPYSFHCAALITAWNGGVMDTERGRLVLWGGGHADYKGNEVYAFDLQSLSWARIWGPTPDGQIPSGGTHETYDDGNPGSRHTYAGLAYVPPPIDAMITASGSLWQSGNMSRAMWRFDFGSSSWTRLPDVPPEMGLGDPMVYDPVTGHVFRRANSEMQELDPATNVLTPRATSNGGFYLHDVAATLDLQHRVMVMMGGGRVDLYDLDADVYEQDVTIMGTNIVPNIGPGVAYDSQQDQVVVWAGGLDVYTFDVPTRSFSLHPGSGDDPGAITSNGGAYGRFQYAPSRNVFVYVDHVDSNVFVYRMSDGQGTPPGGSTSGDSGDTGDASTDDSADSADSATTDSGGDATSGARGSTSSTVGDDGGGATGDAITGGQAEAGQAQDGDEAGCACSQSGRGPSWPLLLCVLALTAARRRSSTG